MIQLAQVELTRIGCLRPTLHGGLPSIGPGVMNRQAKIMLDYGMVQLALVAYPVKPGNHASPVLLNWHPLTSDISGGGRGLTGGHCGTAS